MLLLTEVEKDNPQIPEIMQALSQAAGNPGAHFEIMKGERYITYLLKVQGSQDPILIHSAGSAPVNRINGLGHWFTKYFVFQGLKDSATAFKVDPTKMLVCGNKKRKMLYTEILEAKTPEEIGSIRIPSETWLQNNTTVYFTRYAPVPYL